jgi:hypothetical protein
MQSKAKHLVFVYYGILTINDLLNECLQVGCSTLCGINGIITAQVITDLFTKSYERSCGLLHLPPLLQLTSNTRLTVVRRPPRII